MIIDCETKGVIKKINAILRKGKMTGRGGQKYTIFNTFTINCLGHAFFNFSNQQIRNLRRGYEDELRSFLWGLEEPSDQQDAFKLITEQLEQKICETGLLLEECQINDKIEDGQWKVAYYYKDGDDKDFHFIRQEDDGTWSSKLGSYMEIDHFDTLPLMLGDEYCLAKIIKLLIHMFIKKARLIKKVIKI